MHGGAQHPEEGEARKDWDQLNQKEQCKIGHGELMVVDLIHSVECNKQREKDPEAKRNRGDNPLPDWLCLVDIDIQIFVEYGYHQEHKHMDKIVDLS